MQRQFTQRWQTNLLTSDVAHISLEWFRFLDTLTPTDEAAAVIQRTTSAMQMAETHGLTKLDSSNYVELCSQQPAPAPIPEHPLARVRNVETQRKLTYIGPTGEEEGHFFSFHFGSHRRFSAFRRRSSATSVATPASDRLVRQLFAAYPLVESLSTLR